MNNSEVVSPSLKEKEFGYVERVRRASELVEQLLPTLNELNPIIIKAYEKLSSNGDNQDIGLFTTYLQEANNKGMTNEIAGALDHLVKKSKILREDDPAISVSTPTRKSLLYALLYLTKEFPEDSMALSRMEKEEDEYSKAKSISDNQEYPNLVERYEDAAYVFLENLEKDVIAHTRKARTKRLSKEDLLKRRPNKEWFNHTELLRDIEKKSWIGSTTEWLGRNDQLIDNAIDNILSKSRADFSSDPSNRSMIKSVLRNRLVEYFNLG